MHFALLPPGCEVTPHIDHVEYAKQRSRYHIVVQAKNGSLFRSGIESATLHEREIWYMNTREIHSVQNIDNSPRLHLIFDLLPKKHFSLGERIINAVLNKFYESYLRHYGTKEFSAMLEKNQNLLRALIGK